MPIHVHVKNNTHTHTHTNRPCLCGLAPERGSTFADVFVQGARCLREPACGICRHHTHTHAREHHIITVAFFRHHHHCHTYIHTHKIYQFLPPLGRKFRRLHCLFSTKFQQIIPFSAKTHTGNKKRTARTHAYENAHMRTILVTKSQTISSMIATDSGCGAFSSPNPYIMFATFAHVFVDRTGTYAHEFVHTDIHNHISAPSLI